MSSENKVVFLDKEKLQQKGVLQQAVNKLAGLSLDRLSGMLRGMLDNVDDSLFDMAETGGNASERKEMMDTVRELRLRRADIEKSFRDAITENFRELIRKPKPVVRDQDEAYTDLDSISLVDNEALEVDIAVDTMAAKARARCNQPIDHLCMRLGYLFPSREIGEATNPLDPKAIANAFDKASKVVSLSIESRLIIYKYFDRAVLRELESFYEECNDLLADLGVMPDLRGARRVKKSPASESAARKPEQKAAQKGEGTGGGGGLGEVDADPQLFENLAAMLQKRGKKRWTGTGYEGPEASINDLVAALSMLQRREDVLNEEQQTPLSEFNIKGMIGDSLLEKTGSGKSLGRREDDTIDIVGMLFDVILDDPKLPNVIKALIGRLQIPVVKVALTDRTFFSKKKHPARRLINELARSAVGWQEPRALDRDPFYKTVDHIVNRILNEFGEDPSLFEDVLNDFLIFQEEERERSRLIEERTRQAAEGKAKVDDARGQVAAEIRTRVAGRDLPAPVKTLLEEAWSKVLFITLLKEGEDSEVWQKQVEVVDRLLWSVEPKPEPEARKELLGAIPGLLQDLRGGLNAILYNPFDMAKLFKGLEAVHIKCLSSVGRVEHAPSAASQAPVEGLMREAPRQEEASENLDNLQADDVDFSIEMMGEDEDELREESQEQAQIRRQLEEVAIGTWFEFRGEQAAPMRAKLSARLNKGQRFIFVNRAGFKLADKSVNDLVAEFMAERLTILDDNMLFDRALESVITSLRDTRAGM